MVSVKRAKELYRRGADIIKELLHSENFAKNPVTLGKKQLSIISLLGAMEAGKTTLFNFLGFHSSADIKISWDDKSMKTMKQADIEEFTKIRHYDDHRQQRILLLTAAHRFYLLPKTIRELTTAMIWITLPPPWEIDEIDWLDRIFERYNIITPNRPYSGAILWRNWETFRVEWGWVSWSVLPQEQQVEWTRTDFRSAAGTTSRLPPELELEALLSNANDQVALKI